MSAVTWNALLLVVPWFIVKDTELMPERNVQSPLTKGNKLYVIEDGHPPDEESVALMSHVLLKPIKAPDVGDIDSW
jgi:hypothetical protein